MRFRQLGILTLLASTGCAASPFAGVSNSPSVFSLEPTRIGRECGHTSGAGVPLELQLVAVPQTTRVHLGRGHVCALGADGMRCWGDNQWGQSGGEAFGSCVPARIATQASEMALGGDATCVLSEGIVRCWGRTVPGSNGAVRREATTIAVGSDFVCAANSSEMWCWGVLRRFQEPMPGVGLASTRSLAGPNCPDSAGCTWLIAGDTSVCFGGRYAVTCVGMDGVESVRGWWDAAGEYHQGARSEFRTFGGIRSSCMMGDRFCHLDEDDVVRCASNEPYGFEWAVEHAADIACLDDTLCVALASEFVCRRYSPHGVVRDEERRPGSWLDLEAHEGAMCAIDVARNLYCGGWAAP